MGDPVGRREALAASTINLRPFQPRAILNKDDDSNEADPGADGRIALPDWM